jgi:hypothetical protein
LLGPGLGYSYKFKRLIEAVLLRLTDLQDLEPPQPFQFCFKKKKEEKQKVAGTMRLN